MTLYPLHSNHPLPIITPVDMLLIEMKNTNPSTSTSNAISSSTYTLPPLCPSLIIYRRPPHTIQFCHAIDWSASMVLEHPCWAWIFHQQWSPLQKIIHVLPQQQSHPSIPRSIHQVIYTHQHTQQHHLWHQVNNLRENHCQCILPINPTHHCCLLQRNVIPYQHLTQILLFMIWWG